MGNPPINYHRGRRGDKSRLQVGTMLETCTKVWYEPIGDEDDDKDGPCERGPDIGLYHSPQGDDNEPSPMLGQVKWFGYFEPTAGESRSKVERFIIQRRDLKVMLDYLDETDEAKLESMDEVLDNPRMSRRYQFWLDARAMKNEERRKKAQAQRRKEKLDRKAASIAEMIPGLHAAELQLQDTDDEGFELDDEEQVEKLVEKKRKAKEAMPPPPTGKTKKKRKSNDGPAGGLPNAGRGANRLPQTLNNHYNLPFNMSGGLGSRYGDSQDDGRKGYGLSGSYMRELSIGSSNMDMSAPQGDDNSPAPTRIDSTLDKSAPNNVRRSIETGRRNIIDDTRTRQQNMDENNGAGVDPEVETERLMRETSTRPQQGDLDALARQFAEGYGVGRGGSDARREGASQTVGDSGYLSDGHSNHAVPREGARAGMASGDGIAQGGGGALSSQELEEMLNGNAPGQQSGAQGPFQTDDEDETNGATDGVNGTNGVDAMSGENQDEGVEIDGETGVKGEDGEKGGNGKEQGEDEGEDGGEGGGEERGG